MEEVCIKCGVKKGEKPFIGLFCVDCYNFPIKPPKPIVIKRCKRCFRFKIKGEWKRIDSEQLEEFLKKRIKGEFDEAEIDIKNRKAILYFYIDGKEVKREIDYDVKIETVLCERCSRKAGGYFEAIVQLRGEREKIEDFARDFIKRIRKKGEFVAKIEERKEGIDLYISSSKAVMEILKELGVTYKISRKLHGLKEGKRIYRTTFAIRL